MKITKSFSFRDRQLEVQGWQSVTREACWDRSRPNIVLAAFQILVSRNVQREGDGLKETWKIICKDDGS